MMKRIILYGSLVVFFILALINFRMAKEVINIQEEERLNVPETRTQGPQEEGLSAPETAMRGLPAFPEQEAAQSPYLVENRPAITIIKKPPAKEKPGYFSEDIESKREKRDQGSSSPYSSPAVLEEESDAFSEKGEGDPAITKLNKQPSEAESREMNEAGIIMY